jgi:basic membrane protein A
MVLFGKTRAKLAALAAAAAMALAACASSASDDVTDGGQTGGDAPLKVGFVADVAGLNDRSFNYLGNEGMKQAEAELGVEIRVLTSDSSADYIPNMTTLARQGYDLIIASGFNQVEAVATVSAEFPDTKFAILDVSVTSFEQVNPNVMGLPFQQDQASYLAGYLAALFLQESGEGDTVGSIGGLPIPPVENWMDGFARGVAAVDPSIRVISGYSQTFADPAACMQLAQNQIEQGAVIVFQVAGGCGPGALNAAAEAGVWAIGTDADQANFGEHVLTSAIKRSDVAVYETIRALLNGDFLGGQDRLFTIVDGAVGLGTFSPHVSQELTAKVAEAEAALRAESAS